MNKFELVDNLVSELGLSPEKMISYWQEKKSSAPRVRVRKISSPAPKPEKTIKIPADDEVFIRLKKIISENLDVKEKEIKPETAIQEGLNADSLDMVELIRAYESEFGLSIPDDAAERFKRVQDVWLYISRHAKV